MGCMAARAAAAAPCASSTEASAALSEKLSVDVGDSSPPCAAAEGPGGAETEADAASARSLASHASASSRAISYSVVWLRCAAALAGDGGVRAKRIEARLCAWPERYFYLGGGVKMSR